MNRIALPLFLSMCASALVVAASWDVSPVVADGPRLVHRAVPDLEVRGVVPFATVGKAVDASVSTRVGGRGLTYALAGGELPPGARLNPDGRIDGTFAAAGEFVATVAAIDAAGNRSTARVAFRVLPAAPELAITFAGLPVAGEPMRATVEAPAGSGIIDWSLDRGPAWVRVSGSGNSATVTGDVPPGTTDIDFTVVATDASGRTFYAGSGTMALEPTAATAQAGEPEAAALATTKAP